MEAKYKKNVTDKKEWRYDDQELVANVHCIQFIKYSHHHYISQIKRAITADKYMSK